MTDEQAATRPAPSSPTEILDEFDELATLEHALLAEYLEICYVTGRGQEVPDVESTAFKVGETVFGMALGQMGRLRDVNLLLTKAGRSVQMGKAAQLDVATGAAITFGPLGPTELGKLAQRETKIATALDARYVRLAATIDPEHPLFDDPFGVVDSVLSSGSDHATAVTTLVAQLSAPDATDFRLVTRHDPENDAERILLDLSRRHYDLIVAVVAGRFAHDGELMSDLRTPAQTQMDALDGLSGLLVKRGLLPALT
jgi:hypothetical protein